MNLKSVIAAVLVSLAFLNQASADSAIEPLMGLEVGPNLSDSSGTGTQPRAAFYLHTDGKFYGTTPGGGSRSKGTFVQMTQSGAMTHLSFSDFLPGSVPTSTPVLSSDGWLWGTTSGNPGTIFRMRPETREFQTVHQFANLINEGTGPIAGLVSDGQGNFWGVTRYVTNTSYNGVLYRINELTGAYTVAMTFPTNGTMGSTPTAALYYDGSGNLWGTTTAGGTYGSGTIFKYTIASNALTTVADFTGTSTVAGKPKGSAAGSALVPDGNGFLWGVASTGGASYGTVFKVEMATGIVTTVVEFTANGATNKGSFPIGPLVNDGAGSMWGVSASSSSGATIFKVNVSSGTLTTMLQFDSLTGTNATAKYPVNGLASDGHGYLWGTSTVGGSNASWAVYKVRMSDGGFTKVAEHQAGGVSYRGRTPLAGVSGNATSPLLWGTASVGGTNNLGTLFSYNTSTGETKVVANFTGITGLFQGSKPNSKPYVDAAGVVWGTTETGGAFDYGTAFKYDSNTGVFTTVKAFETSSKTPRGSLVPMSDGLIWGTTSIGSSNSGSVFKIDPATSAFTTVHAFAFATPSDGSQPICGLAEANGFVWGTTTHGGSDSSGSGTLFKIEMATGTYTAVQSFTSATGVPSGDVIVDASGNVWGTTANNVFKYVPGTSTYTNVFTATSTTTVFTGSIYKTLAGEIRFLVTETTNDLPPPNATYSSVRVAIDQVDAITNAVTKVRSLKEAVVGYAFPPDLVPAGGLYQHNDGKFYGVSQSTGTNDKLEPAGGGMIYRIGTGPTAMTQPYSSPPATAFFTQVSGTSVTLRGYVNPNGNATTCQFEWGPTTALGNVINATGSIGTGYTGGICQATLTNLPVNTTYFFRVRANSTGAPSYGPIYSVVTGTSATYPNAEISVESPLDQVLTDNVTIVNLGSHRVGLPYKQSVVVRNLSTGLGAGILTGLTATLSGPNASDYAITTPLGVTSLPSTQLSAGMILTFTPSGPGARTATLTITSNDSDEGSFKIPLTGTGVYLPKIEVDSPTQIGLQNGADSYDFGNSNIQAGVSRNFTIRNTGDLSLTGLNVTVTGANNNDFVVTAQPAASIAAGSSTTFSVTFTPTAAGVRNAILQIASNDADENPFIIQVSGSGVAAPEIEVIDNSTILVDGISTIHCGSVTSGQAIVRTITIRNIGSATLSGLGFSVDGPNNSDFYPYLLGAYSLPAGQQTTFLLRFGPYGNGVRTATLHISSNDSDENPFDIALEGTVGPPLTAVESWRKTWFNSTANSGDSADTYDYDGDGLTNYMEFALGLNPKLSSVTNFQTTVTGGNIEFTYTRSSAAVSAGVIYQVPWTEDLSLPNWNPNDTVQQILSDNGTIQTVKATIPTGTSGHRFVRLQVQ